MCRPSVGYNAYTEEHHFSGALVTNKKGTNAGIWELSCASAEEGNLFEGNRKEKEKEGKNT
ncbi:hypothetical protein GW7_01258 [Heterocephalus glaber]|uniref:Uncharacterized protein n=1 Tax=Heterocephalus glaber TaxID=10181 RepID=G5BQZ2_HETGA|nr:hypothetical protein GW7_01258 [Heterocephalus glaber]